MRTCLKFLPALLGIVLAGHAAESKLHRLDPRTPPGLRELLDHRNGPLPLVSGHRGGAWAGYPENCIPTFERTLRQSFAMLEIDPRLAKDGAVVVHHDATLDRTTTGTGRVADFTLAELRKLRLKDLDGRPTEFPPPTLDEVIEWARGRTVLVLDQKDLSAIERAKIVTRHKAEAWVMLIVMNFKDVQAVHQLNPDIAMEVMIPTLAKAREFDALGVPWANVVAFVGHTPPDDPALYEFIHSNGARCMIGTSRNLDRQFLSKQVAGLKKLEPQYRAFLARGADIIETDIPAPLGEMLYRDTRVPPKLKPYFLSP
ncbi:MAG: glycerophosphodiester phosphodiesterase family protein [Verrucomicrobiae bacterium]|nr:glycerophosphodiester phosphodiesterase family protein [Verrucomicrobiae bacterium]